MAFTACHEFTGCDNSILKLIAYAFYIVDRHTTMFAQDLHRGESGFKVCLKKRVGVGQAETSGRESALNFAIHSINERFGFRIGNMAA